MLVCLPLGEMNRLIYLLDITKRNDGAKDDQCGSFYFVERSVG